MTALAALALLAAVNSTSARPTASPKSSEDYFTLATAEIGAKKWDTATKLVHDAMAKFPDAPGFYLLLGDIEEGQGKVAQAFFDYTWEGLRTGGNRGTGHDATEKARALTQGRGTKDQEQIWQLLSALEKLRTDPKAAPAALQKLEKEHDALVVRFDIAIAKEKSGDRAGAIADYRSLTAADPGFVPSFVNEAVLLKEDGKSADADKLMAKARAIDPQHWRLQVPDGPVTAAVPSPSPSPSPAP